MTDLVVLVPSRGRPANVERLASACEKRCRANTLLVFGFDTDDPDREMSEAAVTRSARFSVGPRMGLVGWTNKLARAHLDAPYLASLGDDMVPETDGWDVELITAVEHMGGGFAYPDDRRRNDIPEAVVVDTRIVAALGWMALPALEHWFCDNVWRDLGAGINRLAYCPDVVVEHRHPNVTGEPSDAVYHEAAGKYNADAAAYRKWRLFKMPSDIVTVRRAVGA